jgi:hypothetical protein
MEIISVLLVINDDFKYSDLIISNLKDSGCNCELLVYNNGCNNLYELENLKEHSSKFLGSENQLLPIGYCLNVLLSSTRNKYYFVINSYGFFNKDWGIDLISNYQNILNSGIISIAENIKEINYAFSLDENLIECYLPEKIKENVFFSINHLQNIGGFDIELDGQLAIRDFSDRVKNSGFINLIITNSYFIKISEYKEHFSITENEYKERLKKIIQNKRHLKESDPLWKQLYFENDKILKIIEDLNNCLKHKFNIYFNDFQGNICIETNEISGEDLKKINDYCCTQKISFKVKSVFTSSYKDNIENLGSLLILELAY